MGEDITRSIKPDWFGQGHLRDDIGKERHSDSATSDVYMYTLKKPQVGMRTETSIQTKDGRWFLMSGMINWVGEASTSDTLATNGSLFWNLVSTPGFNRNINVVNDKRQFILDFLGCVHGQRMTSLSRLSETTSTESSSGTDLPFPKDVVVEISYVFDDTMYFPWTVDGVRFLADQEIDRFSFLFYEYFEGCSCDRCLEKTTKKSASKEDAPS